MKNETLFTQTALEVTSSPPLTSSLHSRNSATSAQESAYLRQASILRWARFGLSALVIVVALAVVGCTGHVLHSYNQTNLDPEYVLPLWPVDVDLKPTLGTMIPATIVASMSLAYIIYTVTPSPHSRTLYQVFLFLLASFLAFAATFFAVLFNQLLLYRFDVNSRDTLQTWTCKLYYSAKDFEGDVGGLRQYTTADSLIPVGFKRLCQESMAGQWMTVALLAVELICCVVAVLGFVAEKKIQKSRNLRYSSEKCESEY